MFTVEAIRNGQQCRTSYPKVTLVDALAYAQEVIWSNRGDTLTIKVLTTDGVTPLVCSWHSSNAKWIYTK